MRLEAVGKRYGIRQPWVVRGVTADLPAGRLIRVSGRNGSGKSTLLRVVAGVSLPSAGKVTGRPHTGYVPERFPGGLPFSGHLNVLDLIAPEDVVVTLSHTGYIKRQPASLYRAQKRGGKGRSATAMKEEDFVEQLWVVNTHDTLLA